jgi:hypothetical protein
VGQFHVVAQPPAPIDNRRVAHVRAQDDEMWDANQSKSKSRLVRLEFRLEAILDVDYGLKVDLGSPIDEARGNVAGIRCDREVLMAADNAQFHGQASRAECRIAA